jgi:hypothetical protein
MGNLEVQARLTIEHQYALPDRGGILSTIETVKGTVTLPDGGMPMNAGEHPRIYFKNGSVSEVQAVTCWPSGKVRKIMRRVKVKP